MPTYILLSTLTPEGRQTLHTNPDRLEAVNQEIAEFGCEVKGQFAVLGMYDFVTIVEAPDNETAAHLSMDLGLPGHRTGRQGQALEAKAGAHGYGSVEVHDQPY